MKYSVDTSAILDRWVRYYPPGVFPSIWRNIEGLIAAGSLHATEEVLRELRKKEDGAYRWAKAQSGLFLPIDDKTQAAVAEILLRYPRLVDTRKNRSSGDPFVIATARVNNLTVITGEKASGKPQKPHIPDVCSGMGIRYSNLLGLFQQEGWKV